MKCRLKKEIPYENALLYILKSSFYYYYYFITASAKSVKSSYTILKTLADDNIVLQFSPFFLYMCVYIKISKYILIYIFVQY